MKNLSDDINYSSSDFCVYTISLFSSDLVENGGKVNCVSRDDILKPCFFVVV